MWKKSDLCTAWFRLNTHDNASKWVTDVNVLDTCVARYPNVYIRNDAPDSNSGNGDRTPDICVSGKRTKEPFVPSRSFFNDWTKCLFHMSYRTNFVRWLFMWWGVTVGINSAGQAQPEPGWAEAVSVTLCQCVCVWLCTVSVTATVTVPVQWTRHWPGFQT